MESTVVVGYDDTPAGAYAFARAQQLGMPVVALYSGTPPPIEHATTPPVTAIDVPTLGSGRVFEEATRRGAVCVVLSDYAHGSIPLLREGLVAARQTCTKHSAPLFGMLIAKYRPDREPAPYRNTLVGVDNTVGSGIASLFAAKLAAESGGGLQVTTIERRRDSVQRKVVDRLKSHDDDFEPESFRSQAGRGRADLTRTRRIVDERSVDASFDYRMGDPSTVLVNAARYGDFDALVSGIIGVHAHGRHGHIGKLTRKIVRLSPVDHLVAFDGISLGLHAPEDAEKIYESAASILFGS